MYSKKDVACKVALTAIWPVRAGFAVSATYTLECVIEENQVLQEPQADCTIRVR